MKLNVLERINLLQILPKEGSYATFKILISLKSALSFTEKEHKDIGMVEKEGAVQWKKTIDKEIEIGEKAKEIIVNALTDLDKEGKINDYTFTLYEKFIKP